MAASHPPARFPTPSWLRTAASDALAERGILLKDRRGSAGLFRPCCPCSPWVLDSPALRPPAGWWAGARESASAPPPLPFPWNRFLLGLLAMLALSGLGGWIAVRLHAMEALGSAFGYVLADPHLWLPLAGAGVAPAGT